tara:strand:- start:1510 stop:1803 length:294 start_codon:yes stop_codon:yes gene_type:complete
MDKNGKPDHIEDYLVSLHSGQWFGWSDSKNKIYKNLIILDSSKTKPTQKQCTDGLSQLQSDFDSKETNKENKKASAITKLKELGLDDDEIKAIKEVV